MPPHIRNKFKLFVSLLSILFTTTCTKSANFNEQVKKYGVDPELVSIHRELSFAGKMYTLRFSVPGEWQTIEKSEKENKDILAFISNKSNINAIDAVFTNVRFIYLSAVEEEQAIAELEERFDDGWVKNDKLSELHTHDGTKVVVFKLTHRAGFTRYQVIIPVKEIPGTFAYIGFQINSLDDVYIVKQLPILIDLIESYKVSPSEVDRSENEAYMKSLLEKKQDKT